MGGEDHVSAEGVRDIPRDKRAAEIADPREIAGFFVRGAAGFGRSKTLIQLDRASVYGTEG